MDGSDEDFKNSVKVHMESELANRKKSNSYANINDQLLNLVNIDIPKYLLEKERHSISDQYKSFMKDIDENTNIDDLASKLSLIDSKSVLSLESLPDIEEFNDHKELLNSAILTAQDLHGRLVASLRNNENDVAQNLISAIKLNKKSEVDFFTKSLENFKIKNLNILKNFKDIP